MLDNKWLTMAKKPVDVHEFLLEMHSQGREFHIATDSQQYDKYTLYATVICALNTEMRSNHRVIYTTTKEKPKIDNMWQRLMLEVVKTITLGAAMEEKHGIQVSGVNVHIDVNPHRKWKSSQFHPALRGMAVGAGFKVVDKPAAWAASHVCDHVVKGKNF